METKIQWTATRAPDGTLHKGYTFNPWWGCTKVSAACKNCYAESLDKRIGGSHWGERSPRRFFGDEYWRRPMAWNRKAEKLGVRLRVFCGSMCDWLEDRPELWPVRVRLLELIQATPNLDWLLLSKRPENLARLVPSYWLRDGAPNNVWLGTTVEDQETAQERIPALQQVAARVRFLSCEPLLEELDLDPASCQFGHTDGDTGAGNCTACGAELDYEGWLDEIDWVIAGAESGGGARPTDPAWIESLRDQCAEFGVPFFLKQLADPAHKGRVISLPVFEGQQHVGQPLVSAR